ncbi:hypothetical protein [Rivularia sp. UHCC 0363]|uniref:hypothetical protein n=1 Tax=Rivularia sp. UHCC 0363 TaxID=3110244 RepID=UPI002B20F763|nr:hypothetical protein [Rivularia sp. UHCC 0363]MEA5597428.1 hypothetical protein [Rivularia sp. UHCC 0363]
MPDLCRYKQHSALRHLIGLPLLAVWLSLGSAALAVDRATLELLTAPLEPALFLPDVPLDPRIGTPDQISQTGLTPPSLWWKRDQFDSNLLTYWLSYPTEADNPGRVDLIVDQQVWGGYNYLQRYTFMNRFGTTASDFGYNMRVFNLQGELLGAYICQFGNQIDNPFDLRSDSPFQPEPDCNVFLNPYGRGAFRGSVTGAF